HRRALAARRVEMSARRAVVHDIHARADLDGAHDPAGLCVERYGLAFRTPDEEEPSRRVQGDAARAFAAVLPGGPRRAVLQRNRDGLAFPEMRVRNAALFVHDQRLGPALDRDLAVANR